MKLFRMLSLALFGSALMYAIAWTLTKEQREYLTVPKQDELMSRDCRLALLDFDCYNGDMFEDWETRYGKGFTVYAALRVVEATQLRYGRRPFLKGWHEYNASR